MQSASNMAVEREDMDNFFRLLSPDFQKLVEYGFVKSGDAYEYHVPILDGQFEMAVRIKLDGSYETQVVDSFTQEPYTLHLNDETVGQFVGKVREAYIDILTDISKKCFFRDVFCSAHAKLAIEYAIKKYGDSLEFLWENFPKDAVFRRKDTQKWYGVMMALNVNKLGLAGDEEADVLVLRIRPENLEEQIDNKAYFPAYHMNKKKWFTVLLDCVDDEKELFRLIDDSYALAK